MKILNALKGVSGEYEVMRLVGAFGSIAYIVCGNAFVFWDMWKNGAHFDITAYCLAFPSGLGVAVGSISGAVALKDRNVAAAKVTQSQVPQA